MRHTEYAVLDFIRKRSNPASSRNRPDGIAGFWPAPSAKTHGQSDDAGSRVNHRVVAPHPPRAENPNMPARWTGRSPFGAGRQGQAHRAAFLRGG